jgi:hypothetical protein
MTEMAFHCLLIANTEPQMPVYGSKTEDWNAA